MKRFMRPTWPSVLALALLTLIATRPARALAESPVKLNNSTGTIHFTTDGVTTFTLEGTASHLGRYQCYGEVVFVPAGDDGSVIGEGFAVFQAANGDLLVGVVTWHAAAEVDHSRTGGIHFSWRDAVQFSDGTVVSSTGRFAETRPPGLVVPALIFFALIEEVVEGVIRILR